MAAGIAEVCYAIESSRSTCHIVFVDSACNEILNKLLHEGRLSLAESHGMLAAW